MCIVNVRHIKAKSTPDQDPSYQTGNVTKHYIIQYRYFRRERDLVNLAVIYMEKHIRGKTNNLFELGGEKEFFYFHCSRRKRRVSIMIVQCKQLPTMLLFTMGNKNIKENKSRNTFDRSRFELELNNIADHNNNNHKSYICFEDLKN